MLAQTRPHRGFTLIELMVSLAILGLLASLVIPLAEVSSRRTKEHELRLALRELRAAIDAYKRAGDEGRIRRDPQGSGYPKSLEILVEGVEDNRSPKKAKIYFLRGVPRDPMHADPTVPASATWLRRAYASEAEDPQEGEDVYDVRSRSDASGLNGIPYKRW